MGKKYFEKPCPICSEKIRGISEKHWRSNLLIHLTQSLKHKLSFDMANKMIEAY